MGGNLTFKETTNFRPLIKPLLLDFSGSDYPSILLVYSQSPVYFAARLILLKL